MNELNFIRKHLGNASIRLIYKSSIHGDSAKTFHSEVSIQPHLLFLIKFHSELNLVVIHLNV